MPKIMPKIMPKFNIGDRVRMSQEILDELDKEGTWAWHNSLKDKILTIRMIGEGPVGWIDYYVEESPFILAEKWLEAAE